MNVLVAYASRHGATEEIARDIAQRLTSRGHVATAEPVSSDPDPEQYEAVVVGSAVYIEHWDKRALEFVHRHAVALASRPTWLFSSGPLGTEHVDENGEDLRITAVPKEIPDLADAIQPRGHAVFFGALDPQKLSVGHRLMRVLPAARELMPEGDFRDWVDIEGWADEVAEELDAVAASSPAGG